MTINDIISELILPDYDILTILRQAKIVAKSLGNSEFLAWVDSELSGYKDGIQVPEYRKMKVSIQATISNGVYTHSNQQMSVLGFPKKIQEKLIYRHFSEGIGDLIELSKSSKEYITYGIDPGFYSYFQELISSEGLYQVTSVYNHIQAGKFRGILCQVGNKLLDFLLELREIIDPNENIITLPILKDKQSKEKIQNLSQQIFYGTVHMSGVNQVGSIGNITINYTQELTDKGVHEEDIKTLKEIAKIEDIEERQKQKNGWMKRVGTYLPVITTMVDFIDTAIDAFL